MVRSALAFVCCVAVNSLTAQTHTVTFNVNDTSFTRIVDGIISNEKFPKEQFEVHFMNGSEASKFGLGSGRNVMVLNSIQRTAAEGYIYEQVRDSFLSSDLPYYVRLPIAINGQLFSLQNREEQFKKLDVQRIKSIVFLNRNKSLNKYSNTPMGVIDVAYR